MLFPCNQTEDSSLTGSVRAYQTDPALGTDKEGRISEKDAFTVGDANTGHIYHGKRLLNEGEKGRL